MNTYSPTIIANFIWPARNNILLRTIIFAICGSLLLTLSAKIKIPLEPVAVTMQVFVVLALSLAFGARLATASVLLYLAQGAAGLPVFTGTPEKGIGLAYMMQGSAGYLLGFLAAAAIVGWLSERGCSRSVFASAIAAMIGLSAIYIPGIVWLGMLLGWDKPILAMGFWPFIGADLIKAALAALLIPTFWHILNRGGRH